jgi:phosphohistidine phosphatase
MARQLWFLRHGDAEPHGTRPDEERALTERGERQSRAAGAALAQLDVRIDAAFTSPRVRALDTARLACESLDGVAAEIHDPLSAGFGAHDALELIAGCDAYAHVLLVGHEPDFSQTVHELSGARIDLKKGGIAAVRLDTGSGELIALLRPREIELLAGV